MTLRWTEHTMCHVTLLADLRTDQLGPVLPVSAVTSPWEISRTFFLMRPVRKTAGRPRRHTVGLIPAQFALYALAWL